MHSALAGAGVSVHHPAISRVEADTFSDELRQELLAHSSHDKRLIQLRKDVQARKNKAADTIAALVCDSHNAGGSLGEKIIRTIRGFLSARTKKVSASWRQLRAKETRIEGKMNCVELEIDQGDESRARYMEMKNLIAEYRQVLDDEEAIIDAKLYRRPGA